MHALATLALAAAAALCAADAPAAPAPATPAVQVGAKILLLTAGRSGSTFLGQLLALHPDVMYFYEPCRSFRWRGVKDADPKMQGLCQGLTKRLLDCEVRPSSPRRPHRARTLLTAPRPLRPAPTTSGSCSATPARSSGTASSTP